MTGIIREHNDLNGLRFTIAEYGLVGAALGLLVAYYLAAGHWLDAALWLGIVANCGTVAGLALLDLRAGATDRGVLPLRSRSFRETVAREHPRLGRRTAILVTVGLLPYALAAPVLVERLRRGPSSATA